MQNEEINEEVKTNNKFNEAFKSYRNFRIKGLIFYAVSFLALIIALFAPSFKVSGKDFYIKYAGYMREIYDDKGSNSNTNTGDAKTGQARLEAIEFTVKLMVDGEDDEEVANELLHAIQDLTHFYNLLQLDNDAFDEAVEEEAEKYASLSRSYSMFDMGRKMWSETSLAKIFDGDKENEIRIFYVESIGSFSTIIAYPLTLIALVVESVCLVVQILLVPLSRKLFDSTLKRKQSAGNAATDTNNTAENKKEWSGFRNIASIGLLFYIPVLIIWLFARSSNLLKNPCALFYRSLKLSPLFFVMMGIEAVALVLTLLNKTNANHATTQLLRLK